MGAWARAAPRINRRNDKAGQPEAGHPCCWRLLWPGGVLAKATVGRILQQVSSRQPHLEIILERLAYQQVGFGHKSSISVAGAGREGVRLLDAWALNGTWWQKGLAAQLPAYVLLQPSTNVTSIQIILSFVPAPM